MSDHLFSEDLNFDEVANYPLVCRQAFLDKTGRCQTASLGVKRHFIYPEIDALLDAYLLWLATFGD